MNYATNIAIIDRETNLVTNIIWGMIYQLDEFNNDNRIAVEVGDLSVTIGDSYDGEGFYRDGEKVLTTAEIMEELRRELADAALAEYEATMALNILIGTNNTEN